VLFGKRCYFGSTKSKCQILGNWIEIDYTKTETYGRPIKFSIDHFHPYIRGGYAKEIEPEKLDLAKLWDQFDSQLKMVWPQLNSPEQQT